LNHSQEQRNFRALLLELAYEYIPTDDIVEHEISTALSGVYKF